MGIVKNNTQIFIYLFEVQPKQYLFYARSLPTNSIVITVSLHFKPTQMAYFFRYEQNQTSCATDDYFVNVRSIFCV